MDNPQTENPASLPIENVQNSTPDTENEDSGLSETARVEKVNQLNERNTGIAIKNVESESLNSLLVYDSDSSSSSEMMKLNLNWQVRDDSDESTTSSSSEEDDSETESDDQSIIEPDPSPSKGAIKKLTPKSTGEELDDLPPVPDLTSLSLNVDDENFVHMGNVLGIVDKLVTVAALPNTPAYDLDTLLFLDNGKRPLGFVFDVLGQVTSPIYAIRFNSVDDIKNLQVQVGTQVYSAPTSKHTQYVFLQQLLKMKGSDASWVGDTECPVEFADYSDDENECHQRHGNQRLLPHVKRTHSSDNYKKFESTMNKRNILNTKFNKYMDSYKQARLNKAKSRRPQAPQISTAVPSFDPSIPPPNWRQHGFYHQQGVSYLPSEYLGMFHEGAASGAENNNERLAYSPSFFTNNFVANLSQTNSANYYTNHAGNNHPGPSHE
ncbi:H/ACA ribonucleoprotein complex non-core subunit NAF1 [Asbolus verrucosus]|uniref:H/ACA ribonucleoprotein complex non-core subunit NAF1 n=1 Tax=Asbolus verrucosus TaxID=1661398 RepID=A0A482VM57_ASBVE|nr:H/ACA ribonucleoprotein complex non-core subunit NAF1 [Asbolus verrucosus]